jgi:protein TonB
MNPQVLSSIISVLFHAAVVLTIVHVSSLVPSHHKPILINFSIEKAPALSNVPEMTKGVSTEKKSLPKIQYKVHKVRPAAKKKEVVKATLPDTNVHDPEERQPVQKESVVALPQKETETIQDKIIPPEPSEDESMYRDVHQDIPAVDDISSEASSDHATESGGATDNYREHASSQYIKQHYKYISRIVQSNISYPYIAKKMLWEGRVTLSFIIKGDGNVQDICLEQSSGFDVLDDNAKETVRNTAPFPPPVVEAKIILPIVYRLL